MCSPEALGLLFNRSQDGILTLTVEALHRMVAPLAQDRLFGLQLNIPKVIFYSSMSIEPVLHRNKALPAPSHVHTRPLLPKLGADHPTGGAEFAVSGAALVDVYVHSVSENIAGGAGAVAERLAAVGRLQYSPLGIPVAATIANVILYTHLAWRAGNSPGNERGGCVVVVVFFTDCNKQAT